ncbi:DDE-type integrase/transposase/recombinase [Streptomyces sp. AK010]|uniref:DDE-type integrase/transposase/recombinase n=1 Tax=Streptomyces sp. AK010 TaxID=2723074 RepID=UPI0037DA7234
MTYVRTWPGWAYVAFVLDMYSRMIVGRQVANHMRTELPLDALEMALWPRRIKRDSGPIHHSDRGSQYVSGRTGDLPVDHLVQRRTPSLRARLCAVGRVRGSLLAQPGANLAVCLNRSRPDSTKLGAAQPG